MSEVSSKRISVIIPVFNVESYLNECLASVRGQSHQNIEILIVEDCSTDQSASIAELHAIEDDRIKFLRHKTNAGLSAARNTGIDVATGEYIIFVDSDDVIDQNLVECALRVAVEYEADLVLYGFQAFVDGVKPLTVDSSKVDSVKEFKNIDPDFFNLGYFAWLKLIRAKWLKDSGIRFPVGYYYEDHTFHWQLGLKSGVKVLMNSKLYGYRQRQKAITHRIDAKSFDRIMMYKMILEEICQMKHLEILADTWLRKYDALVRFLLLNVDESLVADARNRLTELYVGPVREAHLLPRISIIKRLQYWVLFSPLISRPVIAFLRLWKKWFATIRNLKK